MAKASTKNTGLVTVTGHKEIDNALRTLPDAMQKRFIRHALRVSAKKIQAAFKTNVTQAGLIDTKAFLESTKPKALKRSRTRVGVALFTATQEMFARRFKKQAKSKRKLKELKARDFSDEFFYPAVLEFGDAHHPPHAVMRRALYENSRAVRTFFEGDILDSLNKAGRLSR